MLSTFVISFREGLEAGIVIVALLSIVAQLNAKDLAKYIYGGTLSALLFSGVVGAAIFYNMQRFDEAAKQVFEGGMMLFVAALISYFVYWAGSKKGLTETTESFDKSNLNSISLFMITFFTVFKEGLEVVIFLLTDLENSWLNIILGSSGGLILAAVATLIIYKTALRFNLDLVFRAITLILIFIGAKMFGEGVVTFISNPSENATTAATLIYLLPALFLFTKNTIKKYIETKKNN